MSDVGIEFRVYYGTYTVRHRGRAMLETTSADEALEDFRQRVEGEENRQARKYGWETGGAASGGTDEQGGTA